MTPPSAPDEYRPERGGLRERKKARTRAAIRHHALRLFREQGYAKTTVEQIAEAAEVSHMTFFRHFPTKEDVLVNDYNPAVIAAFRAQPAELAPVPALRAALHTVVAGMSGQDLADFRERQRFALEIPQVRAAALLGLSRAVEELTGILAERAGREPDDIAVATLAGSLTGVLLAAILHWTRHPDGDMLAWIDEALACLEAGPRL